MGRILHEFLGVGRPVKTQTPNLEGKLFRIIKVIVSRQETPHKCTVYVPVS